MKRSISKYSKVIDLWDWTVSQSLAEAEITHGNLATGLSTQKVRVYLRLSCSCIVSSIEFVAPGCPWCQTEIELLYQEAGQPILPEQAYWMSVPCQNHSLSCSIPMCGGTPCFKHGSYIDGKPICIVHLREIEREEEYTQQFGNAGPFLKKLTDFTKAKLLGSE